MARSPNWDPRRHPKSLIALAVLLVCLAVFIVGRVQRSGGVATAASSSDTMCVAARIGLSCR